MTGRFQRGLVVGKFSPLHRGHESLIHWAQAECGEVILISYSKPEVPGCEAIRRDRWLSGVFPALRHVVVTDQRLHEWVKTGEGPREVPSDDADEATHRRFCGFLCRRVFGVAVDAVFSGENYGDGFADELTRYFREVDPSCPSVKHVRVDRQVIPISGTSIRRDVHANREWLAPVVYASFVKRVCMLGGESSGKSTLAEALAREFNTTHVAEYGRELWDEKSGQLDFEDMRRIAEVQVRREEDALLRARRFIFCDSSPLTTLFYSRHLFGAAAAELERLAERPYDFTLLCMPDFAFVQDGTRQPEEFRARQHQWYVKELESRNVPYVEMRGPVEARINQARELLGP